MLLWSALLGAVSAAVPSDYNSPPCFSADERRDVLGLTSDFKKEELKNLVASKYGIDEPLRLQLLNWVSSELTAEVLNVILREVMGVNTTYETEIATSSAHGVRAVMGCPHPLDPLTCEEDAALNASSFLLAPHVATEVWAIYGDGIFDKFSANPRFEQKPIKGGVLGYKGREGTFVSRSDIISEAKEQNRVLQWFEGLNDRLGDTTVFMDDIQAIVDRFGLENFTDCNSPSVSYMQDGAAAFKKWFEAEDPDAFEEIDGKIYPKCGEPFAGKVWTSKRARERYNQQQLDGTTGKWCIPFVTSSGYGTTHFLQQMHIWNISACVFNLNWGDYVLAGKEFRALEYWWWPDTTFDAQGPVGVIGLPQDQIQHSEEYYLTPVDATDCNLYANPLLPDVDDVGDPIMLLLQKAQVQTIDMSKMLRAVSTGSNVSETVCAWMKEDNYANMPRVLGWVPVQCAPGEQEVAGACEPCAEGTYSSGGFSARCIPCIAGFHQPLVGQTECSPCPAGFIQPLSGQASCPTQCPAGSFSQRGSAECAPCAPGSFSDAPAQGECQQCPLGHAQAEPGQTSCQGCSPGTYAAVIGLSDCTLCAPGTFTDQQSQKECTICAAGQAQALAGQQSCVNCEPGFFRLADDADAAACRPCAKGYSADDFGRQQDCDRCPQGSFAPAVNSSECIPCGENKVTPYQGSLEESDCVCDVGYFERGDGSCQLCPPGAMCETLDRRVPGQAAGFYVTNQSGPWEAFKCIDESACLASDDLTQRCAENKDDSVLVCARCASDYWPWKNRCNKCSGGAAVLPMIFMILGFIAVMTVTYYICNSPVTRDASALLATSVSFGMMLTAVQSLSMLGQISVSWSSPWSDLIKVLKFFAFDLEVLQMECLADGIGPVVRYLIRVIIPVWTVVVYLALYGGSKLLLPLLNKAAWEWPKTVNSAAQVWQALYISIVLVAFLPFQCYDHPNGDSSVTEFPEVICGEGDHGAMVGLGVLFIVVYGVGFFGLCLWANITAPRMSLLRPTFTLYTRFLFYRFRSDTWYWGSVLMVRSFLIAMVPIVSPDNGNVQVLMLICIVGVFMLLQSHVLPWKTYLLNVSDTAVLLMLLLIAGAASAFTRQVDASSGFTTFILLTFSAGFLTVLCVLGYGVAGACSVARGKPKPVDDNLEKTQADLVHCVKSLSLLTNENVARLLSELGYFDKLAVRKFLGIMSHELQMGIRSSSKRISVSAGNMQDVRSQLQRSMTGSTGNVRNVHTGDVANASSAAHLRTVDVVTTEGIVTAVEL